MPTVPAGSRVHLYTPSDYAAQGAQQWVKTWAAQGWRKKDRQPVKHSELWQALMAAGQTRQIHWHCLKGEARPAESQHADEMARQAAMNADIGSG